MADQQWFHRPRCGPGARRITRTRAAVVVLDEPRAYVLDFSSDSG